MSKASETASKYRKEQKPAKTAEVTPVKKTGASGKPRSFLKKWFYGFYDKDTKKLHARPFVVDGAVIVAIVLLAYAGITASLYGFPSAPASSIQVGITNTGSLEDMTAKYSATAYTSNDALNFSQYKFYRSWIVGTNGSAVDLSLVVGSEVNGVNTTAFYVRFTTNETGYVTFADFFMGFNQNGIYALKVYKEPGIVAGSIFNSTMETYKVGDGAFFLGIVSTNEADSGFYPSWHPNADSNLQIFTLNFTFDTDINSTSILRLEKILRATAVDPNEYFMQGRNNTSSITTPVLSGNRSITFGIFIVNYVHLYRFSVNTTIANMTKIEFSYGSHLWSTVAI